MSYHSKESQELRKKMRPIWDTKYRSSEKGFFLTLWHSLKDRCNKNSSYHNTGRRNKLQINNGIRDRDHLLELWERQKKLLGGPYCIYTGAELTTIATRGRGHGGHNGTNLSIDRINPDMPYQPDNIVFCSWSFNQKKGSATPEDCKKILKVYEEHRARN
jgi:hypothetical protein